MSGSGGRSGQSARVWVFCVLLLLSGSAVAWWATATVEAPADQPFTIPWIVFALAFVVAEWLVVDVEVKREAQTLTFTEAPIALGLLLADPTEFVVVRVVIATLAVAVIRRSPPVKILFNMGQFGLQIGAALLVFHAILGDGSAIDPRGWIAALTAATVSYLISAVAVTTVMALAGAPVEPRAQLMFVGVGLLAALAGSAVSLGAATTLWRDGRSWILLAVIGAAIGYFFVSFLKIRERHQSLAELHVFTTSLAEVASFTDLTHQVVRGIAELLKAYRIVILVPFEGGIGRLEYVDGDVTIEADHAVSDLEWMTALTSAGKQHAGPLSIGRGQTIAGVDLSESSVISVRLPMPDRPGIVLADGRLAASSRPFDSEDVRLLETAAGHAATALYNAQLVTELRREADVRAHQALHDEVTGLVNSRGLQERLADPLRAGQPLAVLTARLDSLREVNETLGRATGDVLLTEIAKRLQPLARPEWCAKTASDEFTLVVPGGADEADMLAARILDAFELPVQCDEVALATTAGIGVALSPEHGTEVEFLLRRASLAASRSRVEGTRVTTWAVDRDPYDPQRLAIAADLRDAIPAGELTVHFQPQVDLSSGRVTGAEALVRWRHPRMGELRPDQFIAAAEYTGAIDALTIHVLEQAATTCARWRAMGWDLEVGVNVSARNLASATFATDVQDVLDRAGLEASAVTLELTESSVMSEAAPSLATLYRLHRMGVTLSIDDFGTGFSSLAHLRRLPVREIKIDKSFVFDLLTNRSDEAIVRSMVELGHNLGMTVIVEGVETVEVRRRLDEIGADRIQGYLLSRPMPVLAFEQWIADRPVRMLGDAATEPGLVAGHPVTDPQLVERRRDDA